MYSHFFTIYMYCMNKMYSHLLKKNILTIYKYIVYDYQYRLVTKKTTVYLKELIFGILNFL
jgi:hypothetical protein